MRERTEADKTVRLTLLGELDLASGDELAERLRQLRDSGQSVRVDLSKLAFIDSSGLGTLLRALTEARSDGWQLEVARQLSPRVERVAHIVGIARVLWPEEPEPGTADQASRPSPSIT
jgi:anti-anti-sigma factor